MTETVSASKKTLKALNTKYVNDEKYRKIMNKHIPLSNISRWNGCVRNTVLLKQSFKKKWYSPEPDISEIPDKIILSSRKKSRHCRNLITKQFLVKKMSKKQKEIIKNKLIEAEESKKDLELRKLEVKKKVINNIFFNDIGGNEVSLGDYYKDKKIDKSISNSSLNKIAKKLFKFDKKTKIMFSPPYTTFNIKFEDSRLGNLYSIIKTPIKITIIIL